MTLRYKVSHCIASSIQLKVTFLLESHINTDKKKPLNYKIQRLF